MGSVITDEGSKPEILSRTAQTAAALTRLKPVWNDDRKETQTAVVWSYLPFTRTGRNLLARHGERRKETRQTEEEVGRQHQGMDRPGVRKVPEGSGKQRKMEETGCEITCCAPTTLAVEGGEVNRISGTCESESAGELASRKL